MAPFLFSSTLGLSGPCPRPRPRPAPSDTTHAAAPARRCSTSQLLRVSNAGHDRDVKALQLVQHLDSWLAEGDTMWAPLAMEKMCQLMLSCVVVMSASPLSSHSTTSQILIQ